MQAYTYDDLGRLKPRILAICEQVAADNPTAWRQAHDGSFSERSRRYNDLCVQALRAAGIWAGMNGKRGDRHSRSDDVLAFGLRAGQGGAQDKGGTFPEMAIIDFIIRAGEPGAHVGWIDQSKADPGIYLEPENLPRVDGGGQPAPTPTPSPQPQPAPPSTDLSAVKAQLASLLEQQQVLILGQATLSGEIASIKTELHHLIGQVVVAEHLDDIKRRVDAAKAAAEQGGGGKCRLPW